MKVLLCGVTRVLGMLAGRLLHCLTSIVSVQLTGAVEPGESLLQRLVRLDAILMERPRPPPHADDEDVAFHVVRSHCSASTF